MVTAIPVGTGVSTVRDERFREIMPPWRVYGGTSSTAQRSPFPKGKA
jgi:hypothetical protein